MKISLQFFIIESNSFVVLSFILKMLPKGRLGYCLLAKFIGNWMSFLINDMIILRNRNIQIFETGKTHIIKMKKEKKYAIN